MCCRGMFWSPGSHLSRRRQQQQLLPLPFRQQMRGQVLLWEVSLLMRRSDDAFCAYVLRFSFRRHRNGLTLMRFGLDVEGGSNLSHVHC